MDQDYTYSRCQTRKKHSNTSRSSRADDKLINCGDKTAHRILDLTPVDYIEEINTRIHALNSHTVLAPIIAQALEDSVNNTHLSGKRRLNLPKLQLTTFAGNIFKLNTFHGAFCAAVHSDDNLDEIQQFQYLLPNLKGEAARTVGGLPLTNTNYNEAQILLHKRYG